MGQKCGANLDGHVKTAPWLFQTATKLVGNQSKQRSDAYCMARHGKKFGPKVIQTSKLEGKKWLAIITEENGDTLSTILNDKIIKKKFTNIFIFDMIKRKIA